MKYRFYITDLYNGVIKGTDDEALARNLPRWKTTLWSIPRRVSG